MTHDADAVLAFVDALEIEAPPPPSPFESEEAAAPPSYTGAAQSFVVGSQISSFAAGFDADLRSAVLNVFLLAQLAADKVLRVTGGGSKAWYAAYTGTLGRLGLLDESRGASRQTVSGSFLEVHNAALDIMTALLGASVAPATMIVKVLESLGKLQESDTQPWITFFERKSQRADASQFQVVHVGAEGGFPVMYLAAFELTARARLTQVLFVKFKDSEAQLSHLSRRITLDPALLRRAAPRIAAKLGAHIDENIDEIDIDEL
ncbi:hypothetical protein [Mesobacterium pallidum]|uniref:hypothetical protein n=1 Tax=Mesobacterium pallidum TaxID=2872037 RepID=UPI001EE25881|nr:hypothetical protein [Mesobacterium pallidum]